MVVLSAARMAKQHELPRVIGKPPPYPASQLSEGTRAYLRKLSKPHIDYSSRGPCHHRGSHSCHFDSVCSRVCAFVACLPRRAKTGTGVLLHAASLAVLIVALSMLGSALMASSSVGEILTIVYSEHRDPEKPTDDALIVVERTLHEHYSIPAYITGRLAIPPPSSMVEHAKQDEFQPCAASRLLLNLLANKMHDDAAAAAVHGNRVSKPRALFATVEGNNIGERVRAVSSALAFAENTDRVPVLFWGIHPQQWNLSWTATFSNISAIEQKILFVNYLVEELPPPEPMATEKEASSLTEAATGGEQHSADHEAVTKDWAEFSVLDVVQDASLLDDTDTPGVAGPLDSSLAGHAKTRGDIRTLDAAAAVDSHISVMLTDEAVSRYAPRAQAATFVSSGLLKASEELQVGVATAYAIEHAFAGVSEDEVSRRLHDSFYIPYLLLLGMRPHMQRLLLQNLVAKQATGVRKPRAIFVNVQFGLGNRLRALGSALAFALETNRVPVLIWVPDHHLNCMYSDLFVEQDEIAVNDGFDSGESWPFDEQRAGDGASKHVMWYNYMRQNDVHVHDPSEPVVDDKNFHIYVSTAYVIQTPVTPYIIRTQSPFWGVLRTLTPQVSVARLVEHLDQMPLHKMMGVHIRSKLIETDISGIGVEEYSKESSTRTDYWRSLTQVDTFIDEMKRQPSTQLFYIAADNIKALEQLQMEFPSRIFYTARRCDGRDRDCLPYALADIILLSKCTSIRGSYWSSFSEVAVRMGGGRVLLAGIDFGRPAVKKRQTSKSTGTAKRTTKKRQPQRRRSKRS